MKTLPTFVKLVPFVDTDMAGIVHFSKILCYVEEAEHAAMAAMGVPALSTEGGFPKVRVECDYRAPLRFQDEVSVDLSLVKVGSRSLTWRFSIKVGQQISAEGGVVTVYTASVKSGGGVMTEDTRARLLRYVSVR